MTRFYIDHPPAPRKLEFRVYDGDYADADCVGDPPRLVGTHCTVAEGLSYGTAKLLAAALDEAAARGCLEALLEGVAEWQAHLQELDL